MFIHKIKTNSKANIDSAFWCDAPFEIEKGYRLWSKVTCPFCYVNYIKKAE
jgi:hypothetical protein